MDFSPTYKAMCLKAHEIQKKWFPAKGDVYLLSPDTETPHFWIDATGAAFFKQGFAILRSEKLIFLQHRIWLPRHNQLMELAQIPGISFQEMTYRFHEWARANLEMPLAIKGEKPYRPPPSIEEAWLAFIMEVRFGKRWDGSDWTLVE